MSTVSKHRSCYDHVRAFITRRAHLLVSPTDPAYWDWLGDESVEPRRSYYDDIFYVVAWLNAHLKRYDGSAQADGAGGVDIPVAFDDTWKDAQAMRLLCADVLAALRTAFAADAALVDANSDSHKDKNDNANNANNDTNNDIHFALWYLCTMCERHAIATHDQLLSRIAAEATAFDRLFRTLRARRHGTPSHRPSQRCALCAFADTLVCPHDAFVRAQLPDSLAMRSALTRAHVRPLICELARSPNPLCLCGVAPLVVLAQACALEQRSSSSSASQSSSSASSPSPSAHAQWAKSLFGKTPSEPLPAEPFIFWSDWVRNERGGRVGATKWWAFVDDSASSTKISAALGLQQFIPQHPWVSLQTCLDNGWDMPAPAGSMISVAFAQYHMLLSASDALIDPLFAQLLNALSVERAIEILRNEKTCATAYNLALSQLLESIARIFANEQPRYGGAQANLVGVVVKEFLRALAQHDYRALAATLPALRVFADKQRAAAKLFHAVSFAERVEAIGGGVVCDHDEHLSCVADPTPCSGCQRYPYAAWLRIDTLGAGSQRLLRSEVWCMACATTSTLAARRAFELPKTTPKSRLHARRVFVDPDVHPDLDALVARAERTLSRVPHAEAVPPRQLFDVSDARTALYNVLPTLAEVSGGSGNVRGRVRIVDVPLLRHRSVLQHIYSVAPQAALRSAVVLLLDASVCREFDASVVLDMTDKSGDPHASGTLMTRSEGSAQPHSEDLALGTTGPRARLAALDAANTPYYMLCDVVAPAAHPLLAALYRRAIPSYLQRRGDDDLFRRLLDTDPDAWHDHLFYYGVFGAGLHMDRWGTVAVNVHWPLDGKKKNEAATPMSEKAMPSAKRRA